MSKTVFTQLDSFKFWYTEQSDVWLDDVKTFYIRPMRCVIVVHPYFLAQQNTLFFWRNLLISRAQKYAFDDSRFFLQTCTRTSA